MGRGDWNTQFIIMKWIVAIWAFVPERMITDDFGNLPDDGEVAFDDWKGKFSFFAQLLVYFFWDTMNFLYQVIFLLDSDHFGVVAYCVFEFVKEKWGGKRDAAAFTIRNVGRIKNSWVSICV